MVSLGGLMREDGILGSMGVPEALSALGQTVTEITNAYRRYVADEVREWAGTVAGIIEPDDGS